MTITYTEKGLWLHDYIVEQGHWLRQVDGVWVSDDDVAVQALIEEFDPLPYAKEARRLDLLAEAGRRAAQVYPFIDTVSDAAAFYDFAADVIATINTASRNQLPARLATFKAIRDTAVALIAQLNASNNWQTIMAYDVVNTPTWP